MSPCEWAQPLPNSNPCFFGEMKWKTLGTRLMFFTQNENAGQLAPARIVERIAKVYWKYSWPCSRDKIWKPHNEDLWMQPTEPGTYPTKMLQSSIFLVFWQDTINFSRMHTQPNGFSQRLHSRDITQVTQVPPGKATQIHLFTRHLDAVDWSDLQQSSMLICREIKKFHHDEKKKTQRFIGPKLSDQKNCNIWTQPCRATWCFSPVGNTIFLKNSVLRIPSPAVMKLPTMRKYSQSKEKNQYPYFPWG